MSFLILHNKYVYQLDKFFHYFYLFFIYILFSNKIETSCFSDANITPSDVRIPTAAPALLIASMAYSTYNNLPSGEKVVVL